MDRRILIAVVLIIVAVFRWWQSEGPINLPDGTMVRINISADKVQKSGYSGQGLKYRGMTILIPEGERLIMGQGVKVIGKVGSRVRENGQVEKILETGDLLILDKEKSPFEVISILSMRLKEKIFSWLPGDNGALAAGILLGGNTGMSNDGLVAFRRSGLSHITAASGYNVTVVAGVVMAGLAARIGRRRAIPFGILCIGLYVLAAGATGAVVRAGVMVTLTLMGKYLGRPTEGWWMLFMSSWLMMMVEPAWITDVGFQLSVAATAGLLMTGGSPEKLAGWKSDLKTSVAATIMTVPIIVYYFGNISIWAPMVNMLVLWCVPWIMEVILVAVGVGVLINSLGELVSYLAWPILSWMRLVSQWAQSWPGNGLEVGQIAWWWVWIYYLAVFIGWWRWKRRKQVWVDG